LPAGSLTNAGPGAVGQVKWIPPSGKHRIMFTRCKRWRRSKRGGRLLTQSVGPAVTGCKAAADKIVRRNKPGRARIIPKVSSTSTREGRSFDAATRKVCKHNTMTERKANEIRVSPASSPTLHAVAWCSYIGWCDYSQGCRSAVPPSVLVSRRPCHVSQSSKWSVPNEIGRICPNRDSRIL